MTNVQHVFMPHTKRYAQHVQRDGFSLTNTTARAFAVNLAFASTRLLIRIPLA